MENPNSPPSGTDGPAVALAAVNLVFYILAIAPIAFCIKKLGFSRGGGWYFLALLTLMRLIGEPMAIASKGQLNLTDGVSIGAFILDSVGLSPLTLAAGGFIVGLNRDIGASNSRIPPQVLRLWGIVPIVALILSIIGGTDLTSSKQSTVNTALTLRTASSALYIVTLALVCIMTFLTLPVARMSQSRGLVILAYAVVPTLPLLVVRMTFQGLSTFGSLESQFSHAQNIWEKAFMGSLVEFLIVIIFLCAGCYAALRHPTAHRSTQAKPAYSADYQRVNGATQMRPPMGQPPANGQYDTEYGGARY